MLQKRTRTLITVGGMSIGVAAIVFLVSIGYGLQNLVISRVAELKEMRQADIMPSQSSNLYIDDELLSRIKNIKNVKDIHPLISLVGRVTFKNSVADVVVHGVTTDYLEESAIQPANGNFFDSRILAKKLPLEDEDYVESDYTGGEVAGETTQSASYGDEIGEVNFKIHPDAWMRVRKGPSVDSQILGYTRRVVGVREGLEVWGGTYYDEAGLGEAGTNGKGNSLGKWIGSKVPIWKRVECDADDLRCEEGNYLKLMDNDGTQVWKTGFFAEINVTIDEKLSSGQVLGETDTAVTSTDSAELEIIEFIQQATQSAEVEREIVSLTEKAEKQAVINRSMLQLLSLEPDEAVGKSFDLKFVVVGDAIPDKKGNKVETEYEAYQIAGIIPGEQNPVVWVPFIDIRSIGVERYSQAKVIVEDKGHLSEVRKQVQVLGYKTSSVADTVSRINSLFSTARMFLLALGLIALVVAALGMFNTLTVSLMERTREVGIMKAMGVKSTEVKDLFLTESMIMGILGGLGGILIGWLAGKGVSLVLTLFAVFKGAGSVDVAVIPMFFLFIIIFLSLLVGFVTGFYPAKRATDISALNALRYE